MILRKRGGFLLAAAISLAGCTSYYRVNDPTTGKVYYTTKIERKDGATLLHDDKSGKEITIQNSEVMQITEDQYKVGQRQN